MSAVGKRFYGKTAVSIRGQKQWDAHDATKTWTDNGEVRAVIEAIVPEVERLIAKNATLGVSEYLSSAEAAMRADENGHLLIGVRIWNDEAAMIVEIPLTDLLVSALAETRDVVGVEPGAQAAVSALVNLGRQLTAVGGAAPPAARTAATRRRATHNGQEAPAYNGLKHG